MARIVYNRAMATIRSYADDDFEGVRHLWETAFPDDPPRNRAAASIPRKLAVQPDLFLVAIDGDAVIGTIMAGYDGHRGWLYSVAVDPGQRRSGIGTALVRHAEDLLGKLGCVKINLQIRTTNLAVVKFYERLGYATDDVISMGRMLG